MPQPKALKKRTTAIEGCLSDCIVWFYVGVCSSIFSFCLEYWFLNLCPRACFDVIIMCGGILYEVFVLN